MRAFYFQKPSMDDNYINNHSFSLINPAIMFRIMSTILLISLIVKITNIIPSYNHLYHSQIMFETIENYNESYMVSNNCQVYLYFNEMTISKRKILF